MPPAPINTPDLEQSRSASHDQSRAQVGFCDHACSDFGPHSDSRVDSHADEPIPYRLSDRDQPIPYRLTERVSQRGAP